jgi:hypothetical protein
MVDTTITKISTDEPTLVSETETLSSSFTSLNLRRENSQTEISDYYINYIDDPSIQSELKMTTDNSSISNAESSCRLEVSQLPEEVIKL